MDKKYSLYKCLIPVRWGDMDAIGHVNNTVYFRYMEQARVEWIELVGFGVGSRDETAVIVNASCTFLRPITYPATVEITMFAGVAGRSSLPTAYELRVAGEERVYAEGAAKIVWMDARTGKSVPLPEKLRGVLQSCQTERS